MTINVKDIIARLQRIPFAVASLEERCTDPGSYARELTNRVYKSIRADIEWCIEELKRERE